MVTSYHNHTTWSDGVPSVAQQLEAAVRCGLDEIGLSDHYVLAPDGLQVDWSMPLDKLGEYLHEVKSQAFNFPGVVVRFGIEADFFPETVNTLKHELSKHQLDFVIGSVHFIDGFPL